MLHVLSAPTSRSTTTSSFLPLTSPLPWDHPLPLPLPLPRILLLLLSSRLAWSQAVPNLLTSTQRQTSTRVPVGDLTTKPSAKSHHSALTQSAPSLLPRAPESAPLPTMPRTSLPSFPTSNHPPHPHPPPLPLPLPLLLPLPPPPTSNALSKDAARGHTKTHAGAAAATRNPSRTTPRSSHAASRNAKKMSTRVPGPAPAVTTKLWSRQGSCQPPKQKQARAQRQRSRSARCPTAPSRHFRTRRGPTRWPARRRTPRRSSPARSLLGVRTRGAPGTSGRGPSQAVGRPTRLRWSRWGW